MSDSVGSVSVEVVPDARGWKTRLEAQIRDITATVKVQLDDAAARASLDDLQRKIDHLSGGRARMDIDTAEANAKLDALIAKEDDAARTRRGKIDVDTTNVVAKLNGITSGLGLIPGLALASSAALLPLSAALAGLGGALGASLLAGGAGIGAFALSAVGNVSSVLGAQKNLATQQTAVQSAAQTQQSALNAVANAEAGLTAAQTQQASAQQNLTAARQAAQAELRSLTDQIRAAQLAEGDASISLREARRNLLLVLANPLSTDLDRDAARQQVKDAQFALHQASESRKQTEAQAARERKAGVAGNPQVIAARQQLAAANAAVAQSQRSVAQAQTAAAASATALQQAQDKLSKTQGILSRPGAQGFIAELDKAKQAYGDFLSATSKPTLGVADQALGIFTDNLPAVAKLSNISADAVGGLLTDIGHFADSPEAASFERFFDRNAPAVITQFGHIGGNVLEGVFGILRKFAPEGRSLGRELEQLTGRFADAGDSPKLRSLLEYIHKISPDVKSTVHALGTDVGHIAQALEPLGEPTLHIIEGIANAFAGIPIPVLTKLAEVVAGFIVLDKLKVFKVTGALSGLANRALAGGAGGGAFSKVAQALGVGNGTPVYVTNWQMIGGGGGSIASEGRFLTKLAKYFIPGGGVEAAELGVAGTAFGTAALAAITGGAVYGSVKYFQAASKGGPVKAGGMTPSQWAHYNQTGQVVPASQLNANGSVKVLQATTTAVDTLRAHLGFAEQDFDMVGVHAHTAMSGASKDVAGLQADLARLTSVNPSIQIKDNSLAVMRNIAAINAAKLYPKDLLIHAKLAQQLDLTYGPGGGMGHPGGAAGSDPTAPNVPHRSGVTYTGPVTIQPHDYHDFTQQMHRKAQLAALDGLPPR